MKKSSIIALMLIITTCLISGCQTSADAILKKVEEVEILNARLYYSYDISLDDYIAQIKKLYVKDFDTSKLESSKEEYAKSAKSQKEYNETSGLDIEIQISKVYEYNNMKYVFTKSESYYKNDKTMKPQIHIKKFMFVKENSDWKIIGVDSRWFEKGSKHASYPTYDNKPLDYVKTLNPLKK